MLLSCARASVLEKRWGQINLINGNLAEPKGKKLFMQIGEHKFNDIEGRLSAESFKGKRVDVAKDSIQRVLVNQSQQFQVVFLWKDIA